MNRRRFLQNIIGVAAAAFLPVTIISYDPIKQTLVRPSRPNVDVLAGYKGAQFMNAGVMYAPYMPLIQTGMISLPSSFCNRTA
jgi:hypothetical protein